jgi:hypothetical protein
MGGLFQKYLARNAIHYRKKYAVVFTLILSLGFCLTLTAYFYSGELASSIQYARLSGDVQLDVDYGAYDVSHKELSGPDKAALRENLTEYFRKGSPYAFSEIPIIPGKVMSGSSSEELSIMGMRSAREVYRARVYSGKEPGLSEICLPKDLAKTMKIGDAVSFVFRDSDQIYSSETFTVSGFVLPAEACEGMAFIDDETLLALDPGLIPRRFVVFDSPRYASVPLMSEAESLSRKAAIETIVTERFGDADFVRAHTEMRTAFDNYRDARDIVDFFLAILVVFIVCLCVVSSISIVNVLFVTVIDRVKIIGMMFSFGLGRTRGTLLLSAEVLVFAAVASLAGIALATVAAFRIGAVIVTSDNKMLETLLGGSESIPMLIGWQSGALTIAAGAIIPFLVSSLTIRKILKGEIVTLIQRAR